MTEVALEVCCGECQTWWVRWSVDLDAPFDPATVRTPVRQPQAARLEMYAFDGEHGDPFEEWMPGTPPPETWHRFRFECPDGCRQQNAQARVDKLGTAVDRVLRSLHETRTPYFRTTVNKLLALVA